VTRELFLLRHAKSSWAHEGLADHERPLNERGTRDARRMGDYFRARGWAPDLVLCSSARRTQETLAGLAFDPPPETLVEDDLYGASAPAMLRRLRSVPKGYGAVLLIAHNPGTHALAVALADAPERIPDYPTAALTHFVLPDGTWSDLDEGALVLDAFVTPKSLP